MLHVGNRAVKASTVRLRRLEKQWREYHDEVPTCKELLRDTVQRKESIVIV